MKKTIEEVLEELKTDFRDLQAYLNEDNRKKENLKRRSKIIINNYLIPELKELSELLECC